MLSAAKLTDCFDLRQNSRALPRVTALTSWVSRRHTRYCQTIRNIDGVTSVSPDSVQDLVGHVTLAVTALNAYDGTRIGRNNWNSTHSLCLHCASIWQHTIDTLPYPTLPYPTLPYPIPYPTLPYPTLPYPTLPYPTLPYPTLPYPTLT